MPANFPRSSSGFENIPNPPLVFGDDPEGLRVFEEVMDILQPKTEISEAIREGRASPTLSAFVKEPPLRNAYMAFLRDNLSKMPAQERQDKMVEVEMYLKKLDEVLEGIAQSRMSSQEAARKLKDSGLLLAIGTVLGSISLGSATITAGTTFASALAYIFYARHLVNAPGALALDYEGGLMKYVRNQLLTSIRPDGA